MYQLEAMPQQVSDIIYYKECILSQGPRLASFNTSRDHKTFKGKTKYWNLIHSLINLSCFFLLRTVLCWCVECGERGQKTHTGSFPPDLQSAADSAGIPAGETSRGRPPSGLWKALRVPHQTGWREERFGVGVWQQRRAHSGKMEERKALKCLEAQFDFTVIQQNARTWGSDF